VRDLIYDGIGGATQKILGGPNLRPTVHVLQNVTQSLQLAVTIM